MYENENPPRRRRRLVLWPLAIAAVVAAFQYFSAQKYTNPETGRAAHVALSEGQEAALGLQSYEDVLSQSQVINSGPEVELVKKVMNRLEAATRSAGKNMDWQVSVVNSPQANAFCLPGGKMVVYTGILPVAQSEAGLATVLGRDGPRNEPARFPTFVAEQAFQHPYDWRKCLARTRRYGHATENGSDGSPGRRRQIWRPFALQPKSRI